MGWEGAISRHVPHEALREAMSPEIPGQNTDTSALLHICEHPWWALWSVSITRFLNFSGITVLEQYRMTSS